ncbi:hypothetical protein LOZ66_005198 [Ophidiomyces ophidiicola]|nr:hypothetical protein LOZ66_005198 [Ophidiomyces ophidiicola]
MKAPFQPLPQNNTLQSPFLQTQPSFTAMYPRPGTQEYPFGKIEVDNGEASEAVSAYPSNGAYGRVSAAEFPQLASTQLTFVRSAQHPSHHRAADMRRTRSGNSTSSKGSPKMPKFPETDKTRVARMARVRRRPRTPRVDNKCGPIVTAPLSFLTKHMAHIPVRDMEAWVNRTAEVRRREVVLKNGKIARPMNSFMLYRSAYAERTKEWCAQNNHQVVSRASGQSWPLEPKEIRDLYERYASIERDNHQKAHPDYKFAPNKTQNTPKQKSKSSLKDEESSDLDDTGIEIASYPRTIRRWNNRSEVDEGFGSRTSTPFDPERTFESCNSTPLLDRHNAEMYMHHPDINRSSWEMINPGRPLPGVLSPPEHSHYYQPSVHQSQLGPNIEDVTYKKMGMPGVSYEAQESLTGLPGNPHPDLLPSQQPNRPVEDPGQVDPQLLEYNNHHHRQAAAMHHAEASNYPGQLELWQAPPSTNQHYVHSTIPVQDGDGYSMMPSQQGLHHSTPMVEGRESWSEGQGPVPEPVKQEYGQEFDQWLTGHAAY